MNSLVRPAPLVSIIIATYNRSNVLRLVMDCARCNTLQDWEMIVVGDACTDDTAQVVQAFNDPRIQFINLPQNCGEQSGPNNVGCQHARGRYIAFLNHDDFWLPHHLKSLTRAIEQTGADLVFGLGLVVYGHGGRGISGAMTHETFEPYVSVPASLWLFRSEMVHSVGLWTSARHLYGAPSQDWLFRAWRAGKRMLQVTDISTIILDSATRKGAYARRDNAEHAEWHKRILHEPNLMAHELTHTAARLAAESTAPYTRWLVQRAAWNALSRLALTFGMAPLELRSRLHFRKKGGAIDHLRKIRGLPAILNP